MDRCDICSRVNDATAIVSDCLGQFRVCPDCLELVCEFLGAHITVENKSDQQEAALQQVEVSSAQAR